MPGNATHINFTCQLEYSLVPGNPWEKNYKKFYILSPAFIESPCLYITMVCVLLFTVIADWYSADGPRGTAGFQMMDSWEFFIS